MGWDLVYEQDQNGEKTGGDIKELIYAVQNGKEVRVLVNDVERDFQYVFGAELLVHRNGVIHAQNSSIISVKNFTENNLLKFKEDCYRWFIIVNSMGYCNISRWQVGEHKIPDHKGNTSEKLAMKWFAKL